MEPSKTTILYRIETSLSINNSSCLPIELESVAWVNTQGTQLGSDR